MSRREIWMLTGIGFNTIASLTAIALWALAPQRGGASRCLPGEATVSTPPLPAQPLPPPPRRAPARLERGRAAPPDSETSGEVPEGVVQFQPKQAQGGPVSTSVAALAERLHIDPHVLALQLGDARGEVPALSADRLERGFKAGEALARRLDLDPSRTQSVVALLTYYVFSKLREEKASPSGVDPARLEALTDALLGDLRVTCGEATAAAIKNDLAGL